MVKIMENPIKMDDLGGKNPIYGLIFKGSYLNGPFWVPFVLHICSIVAGVLIDRTCVFKSF